jgi:hypothetical protein
MITPRRRTAVLAHALALLVGCSSVIVAPDECKQDESCETCVADGQEYEVGFSYADTCGSCTCQADGEFHCTRADDCAPSCYVGGVEYPDGSTWEDPSGCGTCYCFEGEATCEAIACPACVWEGEEYYPGEEFPASDGCNTCTCEGGGQVSCTLAICEVTCSWGEGVYQPGESFPAGDGCNTCTCGDDGSVSCTELACSCNPTAEWWRSYVTTSPAECELIDYVCPGVTTSFQNECGCGCEQSQTCPEVFDCQPPSPCDLPWIEENCPFSVVAL